jgi:ribosomal protein S18 acetylase RimI-like enzyme
VYLTKQLKDRETEHVDDDGYFDFHYSAKGHRVRIRPMEIDDLFPIYAIGESIFTSKSSNLFHFWDETTIMHSYLSDPEYCITATVKEEDGSETVVGFAFGNTIEKPRSSWRYGYLVWLGCHPDYQGLGLASQIYNVMVELFALEKVRMLMIDTQQNNEGALRFFRKLGFGHDEEHVYLSNAPMTEARIESDMVVEAEREMNEN